MGRGRSVGDGSPGENSRDEPDQNVSRRGSMLRALITAATVAGAVLFLAPLLGRSTQTIGPGEVEIGFRPVLDGRTTLALPPIGQAAAPTHSGPVEVRMELQSLDVTRHVGPDGRVDAPELRSSIEADLRSTAQRVITRFVLIAGAIGAVAAAALPWRRVRTVLLGAVGGMILAGGLVASAVPDFDVAQFDYLTYEGPITAGSQVVRSLSSSGGPVGDRVDALAAKLAGLYSASLTEQLAGDGDEVVILHISDLHLNPIGARLARRLAENFEVDAVLDTGDTTSFGSDVEGAYADLLADFGVPYLFVAGNHDSRPNRRAIGATSGVVALDRTAVDIGGVRIAGFDDPLITTTEDVPREEREQVELDAVPALRALIAREEPDVVAVHNPVILQGVVGLVDVAVAGHQHEARLGARDGTIISLAGSTGATGLGSLLVDSDLPASASLLRFRGGELVAVDELSVLGVGGDLVIRRHTITDEDRVGDTADFIGRDVDEAIEPAGDGDDVRPESDEEPTTSSSTRGSTSTTVGATTPTTSLPGGSATD